MSLGARAAFQPPPHVPTRPNLLSSIPGTVTEGLGRWTSGISYQPDGTDAWSVDTCTSGDKPESVEPPLVEWDAYGLGAKVKCSTLGNDIADIEARARRKLDTQTSHLVENILWTNTVEATDFGATHPNVGLSDDDLPTTTVAPAYGEIYLPNDYDAYPIVTAFSDMIEALTEALGGARGMIHCEKRLTTHEAFAGVAVRNGNRLETTLGDHIVVPGTGYPGTGPAGNAPGKFHTWIYGTSMVDVLLSPIEVFGTAAQSINRSTNLVEYRAERMALAHWDRTAHIGVSICLEDPYGDCEGTGS